MNENNFPFFEIPILFLIFNRPVQTSEVFNKIRDRRPSYLFIAADGPRIDNLNDIELCKHCLEIVSKVDWNCEVKTLFRDKNLGCGAAPAEAITWFFDQVEYGIILEDDCVPNNSFFKFCECLLKKYIENPAVMMICGTSFQPCPLTSSTYYFSKYPHVWGWAGWKRSWRQYNFSLNTENENTMKGVIDATFSNRRERKMWYYNMKMITEGLDAWDYQWMYWIWKNNGFCITPWWNMVANIGFGTDATHTFSSASNQSRMTQYELDTIINPLLVKVNRKADNYERLNILISPIREIYLNKFKNGLKRLKNIIIRTDNNNRYSK